MTNHLDRLAREVALVVDNQIRNGPGLSTIMPLHGQMQRVPGTKATPVDDLDRMRQLGGNQAASDTIIYGTATFNSRQNNDETVLHTA